MPLCWVLLLPLVGHAGDGGGGTCERCFPGVCVAGDFPCDVAGHWGTDAEEELLPRSRHLGIIAARHNKQLNPSCRISSLSLKPMYNVEMCRAFGVALLLCLCSIVMIWPRHDHSIAAVLATAQQEHDNNMARSKQDLGKDTAMAWQEHGNSKARAWQDHDQDTTRTWQEHGKDMAIAWRDHRKNMARAWQEHVNGLAISWRHPPCVPVL